MEDKHDRLRGRNSVSIPCLTNSVGTGCPPIYLLMPTSPLCAAVTNCCNNQTQSTANVPRRRGGACRVEPHRLVNNGLQEWQALQRVKALAQHRQGSVQVTVAGQARCFQLCQQLRLCLGVCGDAVEDPGDGVCCCLGRHDLHGKEWGICKQKVNF